MATFFEQQLDYIIFFYGTSFFVLAAACYVAWKRGDSTLPWKWLFLFGITHGLNEWLDLFVFSLGGGGVIAYLRIASLTLSFIFLMEFGIAGTYPRHKALRWVPVLLGAIPLLAMNSGASGVLSISRYTIGLTGGLWASAAYWTSSRKQSSPCLKYAAWIMFFYALQVGLITHAAPFFPASVLNDDTFFRAAHIPIQFIKAITIYAASIIVLYYVRELSLRQQREAPFHFARYLAALLILIITGFGFTVFLGNRAEGEARRNLLSRALSAAAAINPERVRTLTGTPADIDKPDYIRLKKQIQMIKSANPESHFVYMMGLRGDKLIFLVDSEEVTSKDYTGPGYVYEDSTPAYVADYKNGHNTVYDVYKDSWGTWVTGAAYIRDEKGAVLAQFDLDVDAKRWGAGIREYRFFGILTTFGILVTFGVCLLSFSFYMAWLRTRQLAEHDAALRVATQKLAGDKKLREITGSLGEGVIVQDQNGLVSFVNPEAERLLGWSEHEINGTSLYELLKCRNRDNRVIPAAAFATGVTLANGNTIRSDNEMFIRKDGSFFPVSYVTSPIMEDGAASSAVIAFTDITGRKNMEQQRKDFYAMVTHDLKSPVTIIQGYTEILSAKPATLLDPDSKLMMGAIQNNCCRLLNIMDDFLSVSHFESGSLSLNESAEDIRELLTESCSGIYSLAQKKKLLVETSFQEGLPRAMLDKIQLQRAINNLLTNAINYTPQGGRITVCASVSSSGDEKFIVISVSDTGPGIPTADAERIFDKYYRSRHTSGIKGSGLGLTIVKNVAAAHGGSVTLESTDESTESKGSTFKISIPVKSPVHQ